MTHKGQQRALTGLFAAAAGEAPAGSADRRTASGARRRPGTTTLDSVSGWLGRGNKVMPGERLSANASNHRTTRTLATAFCLGDSSNDGLPARTSRFILFSISFN